MKRTSEAAFETAIEAVLLANGYSTVDGKGFDRERAIFPTEALAFIQATQAKVWEKLEALHGAQTGNRVLESLCKWLDTHGALATLRHGFKYFGKMQQFVGPRKERRAALITAAVTGQIPLEEMRA
ncbi:MAG: hypothetical protein WAW42_01305 [Candidatus Competibacteraceae bacterium]